MTRQLLVEADGGSRGNPGPAGYGAVVADARSGEVLAELSDAIGTATNNVAEYSGLVAGLAAAADLVPGADVEVRMDSKLVVEQMSGRWKVKDAGLRELAGSARDAQDRLGAVIYMWVPRAENARADRLANEAMDAAAGGGRRAAQLVASPRQEPAQPAAGPPAGSGAGGWGPPQGQATTTLLLRHGETPLSAERRFAGRGDIPLTDTGRRQAAAAARRLAARGGVGVVASSPLRRALRTAEAAAKATGAPLVVEDDLVETDFGKWEGMTFAEAAAQWPEEMSAWLAAADAAPPGGESFAATALRVLGALDRLLAAYPGQTLLLVSHVTPIKTIACRALLAPPATLFRIHLSVASLSEIDWFADGPALVRTLNDTAHLRSRGRRARELPG